MVDGIGNTTGSIKDLPIYQQYYQLYLEYNKENKTNISFDAWLQRTQYKQFFLQQVENYIETGSVNGGDGVNGNTLNIAKYVNNGNSSMYQSQDEETYYDFDFDNGTYTVYNSNEEVASVLGLDSDTPIDAISFGYKTAEISNYTFGNLEDGQDSTSRSLTQGKYGRVSYSEKEFDIDYIMNALLMNPNDPQYQKAAAIFDELVANMNQWCSAEDLAELDSVAAQYGTNSTEYKDKLKEIILKNLDQANEWVEGHEHLAFNNDASVSLDPEVEESVEGEIPKYDKTDLLTNAGLVVDYSNGTTRSAESTDTRQIARDKLQSQFQSDLNAIVASLQAQLGDQLTPEIQNYINRAAQMVSANEVVMTTSKHHHGFMDMHVKYRAEYSVKTLADKFLSTFETLCKNRGKTDEEVAAAKKIQEEDKAARTSEYKTLYDMDLNSLASSEGIKDVTVVPTGSNQYAEIQTKAESSIINPLKEKIKAKLQSKKIPENDLKELLDAAATAALANPQNWATTDNNYTYTIDADKLIDIYEEFIKQGIKSKGYEF